MPEAVSFHRVYDNVIRPELCKKVIESFEADTDGQHEGTLINDVRSTSLKRTTDIRIGDRLATSVGREIWQEIDAALFKAISSTWFQYQRDVPSIRYITAKHGFEDTGYQLQRYAQGSGAFGPHIDACSLESIDRVAAVVIYFNTVKLGGGTKFPYWNEVVAPIEGRVLWFPATWTHLHEGLVPASDHKYVASTFMRFKKTSD